MQEVLEVYTSPFLDTDGLKMALRARKGFRSFWETNLRAGYFLEVRTDVHVFEWQVSSNIENNIT